MNKKQIGVNIASGISSGIVTLCISFLLAPYLIKNLGDEAYGYIGLSSSFIAIASVFTTALNSMANRHIMVAYANKNGNKVDEYFSSLFASNLVLSGVFLVIGLITTFNINTIFNISPVLVSVVKITFILSIVNFSIITMGTVFTLATFLQDRLELVAIMDIAANIAKVAFLIIIFSVITPQIYYVTLGGIVYTIALYAGHIYNTKKLLPEVKIKFSLIKLNTIKELITSGSWNSINSIMILLMNGMDLALANWLIGGHAMGLISITSTLTTASNIAVVAVIGAFKPTLTKTFAIENKDTLHKQISTSNRMQCMVAVVPIIGLCIFGYKFYTLWLPFKTQIEIGILATITAVKTLDQIIGLTVDAISTNFVLFNNLKSTAIIKVIISIINIPLVVVLVLIFDNYIISILMVSCVSSFLMVFYYWIAVPIMASRTTGQKISEYYKIIFEAIKLVLILIVPFALINYFTVCNSWLSFIVVAGATGALGYLLMFTFGLKKEEKMFVYNKVKDIMRRKV